MIKLKIRKLNGDIIHSNWSGIYKDDHYLRLEIFGFFNENKISHRERNDWSKKTKNGFTGNRYLNYISFYKEEDANYFRLVFGDKLKIAELSGVR